MSAPLTVNPRMWRIVDALYVLETPSSPRIVNLFSPFSRLTSTRWGSMTIRAIT